jgi:DNA primase
LAKLTIYVPDEIAEAVRQAGDINVSAVCQRALAEEVRQRGAEMGEVTTLLARVRQDVAKLQKEWPRIEEAARHLPTKEERERLLRDLSKAARHLPTKKERDELLRQLSHMTRALPTKEQLSNLPTAKQIRDAARRRNVKPPDGDDS